MAMRIKITSEQAKSKTRKQEWTALFNSVIELCPADNPYFESEQKKLKAICEIAQSFTGSELNAWATKLRENVEAQRLYRDGHWLDSPEDYNTKSAQLINLIYTDLLSEKIAVATARSLRRKQVAKC